MRDIGVGEKLKIDLTDILLEFEKLIGPNKDWDKKLTLSNWAQYTNRGNQLLKSSSFHNKYQNILILAGTHMGLKDFYYQANPTFRIQLPNTKSVSFHRDDLSSGHAKKIINFWFPLTELNQDNCLWIVEKEESTKLIKRLKDEHLSLNSFDAIAREKAKPALITRNEMLCFSNRILHGTKNNNSNNVRISLDFRCLPIDEDPGTKKLDVDYKKWSSTDEISLTKCISVIFQSGDFSHIGHNAQRAVVNDFAARNGFSIIRETSEWHHLDFYPTMLDILENTPEVPILIFSKKSFDLKSEAWRSLALQLKKHSGKVYFCLENELF